MSKFVFLAAAAAVAVATPTFAQGHGHGGPGDGGGRGGAARVKATGSHGGGSQGQRSAEHEKQPHGPGAGRHAERPHDAGVRALHPQQGGASRQAFRDTRPHGREHGRQMAHSDGWGKSVDGPKQRWAGRDQFHGHGNLRSVSHPVERRFVRRVDWRRPGFNWASVRIDCPPGLAKKGNGCLPPGQARKWFVPGQRFAVAGYPWDRDDYGYYDWYGVRPYAVPVRYSSFYYDTPGSYYRNYGGNIYRVATGTDVVLGLIPLLGGAFAVGQPMPIGYDVYNVPYGYRSVYYDRPDVSYRYGDRAIYAVDPQTSLVEDVVALVTGDVAVGQPLPAGYDVYNVPFAYRDRYYDTDQYLYRYSDGYVYQVEPRTRIVQNAIIVA